MIVSDGLGCINHLVCIIHLCLPAGGCASVVWCVAADLDSWVFMAVLHNGRMGPCLGARQQELVTPQQGQGNLQTGSGMSTPCLMGLGLNGAPASARNGVRSCWHRSTLFCILHDPFRQSCPTLWLLPADKCLCSCVC